MSNITVEGVLVGNQVIAQSFYNLSLHNFFSCCITSCERILLWFWNKCFNSCIYCCYHNNNIGFVDYVF